MGKLYVVGTPIGNLQDITLRALETLKKVDIIACEDTNVTRKLLNHFEISGKKLIAYHNFNELNSTKGILKLVVDNDQNVALVSDAGMPVISDPGFILIREAREQGVEIEFIPGVSAQSLAFVIANFSNSYSFLGFLPPKSGKRQNLLKKLIAGNYIFYVSPHNLIQVLEDIDVVFANRAKLCLLKELTKLYETHFFGSAQEIMELLTQDKTAIKGEFTLVLNF